MLGKERDRRKTPTIVVFLLLCRLFVCFYWFGNVESCGEARGREKYIKGGKLERKSEEEAHEGGLNA